MFPDGSTELQKGTKNNGNNKYMGKEKRIVSDLKPE